MNKKNTLSDLNDQLNELKILVSSFEQEQYLNTESQRLIQDLSEKKGSFLGIKYAKDPTTKELLDVSRSLHNETNQGFINIYKQFDKLYEVNIVIFRLFMVMNQLTTMSEQRIVGAYALINNTQKEIKRNSKQTSIQGNQLKEMVLMHLQHIKKEQRYRFLNTITYKIIVGIVALSSLFFSLFL